MKCSFRYSAWLLSLLGFLMSANATLYALNDTEATGVFRLLEIDTTTGKRSTVSKTGAVIPYIPWQSSVDADNSILYFVGQKNFTFDNLKLSLVSVSLTTGEMISSFPIPVPEKGYGILSADCAFAADLKLVILSFTTLALDNIVGTYNPETGVWKVVTSLPASLGLDGLDQAAGVYVPRFGGMYIWQLGLNKMSIVQFAYNFKTGELRNATSAQFTNFVYNPKDQMLWGHGITTTPVDPSTGKQYYVRTLEKMNPATLMVEQVATLPSLTIDAGMSTALDVDEQIMYWPSNLFKDRDSPGPPPVYLAQVSLVNASVISNSVMLCPIWIFSFNGNTTCPATLDVF